MKNSNMISGHNLRLRDNKIEKKLPGSPGSANTRRNPSRSSDNEEAEYSNNKISSNLDDGDDCFSSHDDSHNASGSQATSSSSRSSPAMNVQEDDPLQRNKKHGMNTFVIASIIILVLVSLFFFWLRDLSEQPVEKDLFGELKKSLVILKQEFPSQSVRLWRVIGTAVKQVVVYDEPQHPAVILIAASDSHLASHTSSCLAYRLLQYINQIYDLNETHYIDSKLLDHSSPSQEKLHLDDSLKSKLDNRSKGVVVDHIESLSPTASLLFHGYCDGDNAPFKKTTIALVYHTNVPREGLSEKVVEQTLTSMWESDLDEDKIPALLSRIANNVAMISEETIEQLSKVCLDFIR